MRVRRIGMDPGGLRHGPGRANIILASDLTGMRSKQAGCIFFSGIRASLSVRISEGLAHIPAVKGNLAVDTETEEGSLLQKSSSQPGMPL
jgi:hypothetical protein